MKKLLLFSLVSFLLVVSVNADIVGTDSFTYADGAIAGKSGGTGWDWKGNGNPQGSSPTSWQNMAGITDVSSGRLVLGDTGAGWIAARREFGSDTWGAAAFQSTGIVYFAATLTINETQGWLGISAMDGTNEKVKFGMPWQGGGLGYLGINNENNGVNNLSTVLTTVGQPYRVVGVLDFNHNAARMWVDPDSGDYDTTLGTTADVVFNDLGMWNWINGVRISSGLGTTWDDVIIATTFPETFVPGSLWNKPHDPDPAAGAVDVLVGSTLSWAVSQDPNGMVDPNLVSMKLYMGSGTDPNLFFVADITSWNPTTKRASYTPSSPLSYDTTYRWRVDSIQDNTAVVTGAVWTFASEKSIPTIPPAGQPGYQVVDAAASASFTVTVSSISTPTYQWYKYVDGTSDVQLSNGGDISGAQAATLEIANVELADEGAYYCIVNNDSGTPVPSEKAVLGVKRKIAYWDFEGSNTGSTIAGSPATVVYGDPVFTTDAIVGSAAMAFDNDAGAIDLLYTDPDNTAYFDICNYTMTVSCWIKTTSYTWWGPLIARNGEGSEGWQFRNRGDTNKICFSTRGTGNDDGSASDRTVYDGNWHFAVATYDGSVKNIYIDGVLSISNAASGLINPTPSPLSIAGRVKGSTGNLVFEAVTACTLDDVSIYNYALDANAIAQIYADVTQTNVCPEHPAYDLDGDCRVDMDDFVLLAGEWLLDNTVSPN